MKTIINFIFTYKDGCGWDVQKQAWKILRKLKKYDTGEVLVANRIYAIDQEDDIYKQVCLICQKHNEDIEFKILRYDVFLTGEEERQALAFVLNLPDYYCEEYEDIDYEYIRCKQCEAEDRSPMDIYIQPTRYVKKMQSNAGMATVEGLQEILLSSELVNVLKNEGVGNEFFQPVFTKRKRIVGYVFATSNIMPKGSYIDENYEYEKTCELCGKISLKTNRQKFVVEPKYLKEDAISKMEHVNYSFEYYDGRREIIISPKVQSVIKKYVKEATFIPIFGETRRD